MALGQLAAAAALLLALAPGVAANFQGEGTYYGDNGWAGYCAGNVPNAGKPWPPAGGQYGQRVALNSPQFGPHGAIEPCGRKLMFRGTGSGSGGNPISKEWQKGQVTNLCPECKYGDVDLGANGDGRWGIEWYWVEDGDSGGNQVESATKGRAVVPKKATAKPKPQTQAQKRARTSYLFQLQVAKKWLQRMQSTKYGTVYYNALRYRKLAVMRAAKYKKVMLGRKLLLR